ncbi:eCIS core domain-containing protein [Saccharothrix syringae]|uniref:eCIS core domain-containing protein n=1 Tax=Saccharothrix syringae TaxID=103733 RepID=UPI0007C4F6A5|nr:DUF4157 domain-containing protein [Saccharothrix syringae]
MHDHEHDEDRGRRDRPPVTEERVGTAAGEVVRLQRLIGNTAVTGAIRRGSGVGGVPGGGKPLDAALRREVEGELGADFSGVRLHTGPDARESAGEFGARAYTSGDHVVVGEDDVDRHTLIHELTHVLQQRQGPVAGTDRGDGVRVSDPSDRFERAAEENATRVMRGDTATTRGDAATTHAGDAPATPAVQRTLLVGGQDLTPGQGGNTQSAMQVWQQVIALPAFQARSDDDKGAMMRQFRKWVTDQPAPGQNPSPSVWGHKKQRRSYERVEDLEAALHGWVAAKPERHEEKEYAEVIVQDPEVDLRLNSVLYRVAQKIDELAESGGEGLAAKRDAILAELREGTTTGPHGGDYSVPTQRPRGWYQYYLTSRGRERDDYLNTLPGINQGVHHVLENPEEYTFLDKVVVLHDLMEYFGEQRPWNPPGAGTGLLPDPGAGASLATTGIVGGVRTTTTHRGRVAGFASTRDEQEDSTRFARQHNLPVWSGSSHTTVHLLNLARWAGASVEEMTAVAHGIFAFWRLLYDHTSTMAPHTLHEVMDMARNFGVPYDPLNRYEGLDHEDVAAEHASIRDDLEARIGQLEEHLSALVAGLDEDDPDVDAFSRRYEEALAAVESFVGDFERAADDNERRRVLMRAMRALSYMQRGARELREDLNSRAVQQTS